MDDPKKPVARSYGEEAYRSKDKLVYSTDKELIVKLLRDAGVSELEIMKTILSGVADTNTRKYLLLEYSELLGKEPTEILREAAKHALITSSRMPPKKR